MKNCVIVGASGAIGKAFVNAFTDSTEYQSILALLRSPQIFTSAKVISVAIDYSFEESIINAAQKAKEMGTIDLIIVATGILYNEKIKIQ